MDENFFEDGDINVKKIAAFARKNAEQEQETNGNSQLNKSRRLFGLPAPDPVPSNFIGIIDQLNPKHKYKIENPPTNDKTDGGYDFFAATADSRTAEYHRQDHERTLREAARRDRKEALIKHVETNIKNSNEANSSSNFLTHARREKFLQKQDESFAQLAKELKLDYISKNSYEEFSGDYFEPVSGYEELGEKELAERNKKLAEQILQERIHQANRRADIESRWEEYKRNAPLRRVNMNIRHLDDKIARTRQLIQSDYGVIKNSGFLSESEMLNERGSFIGRNIAKAKSFITGNWIYDRNYKEKQLRKVLRSKQNNLLEQKYSQEDLRESILNGEISFSKNPTRQELMEMGNSFKYADTSKIKEGYENRQKKKMATEAKAAKGESFHWKGKAAAAASLIGLGAIIGNMFSGGHRSNAELYNPNPQYYS